MTKGAQSILERAEEVYVRAQDPRNVATHAQRATIALELAHLAGMLRQAGEVSDARAYFDAAASVIA